MFLAYDIGGTKIAAGIVTETGKVLHEVRVPVVTSSGPRAFVDQIVQVGAELKSQFPGGLRAIGVASAGPLDPRQGILLNPTNLKSKSGKTWGKLSLAQPLARALKMPVAMDNDAAAALMAEHWKGALRGVPDGMILTLGTGLGTAVIANGDLVRSGRHLHTEAGHIILRVGDRSAPCGCGNLGCAEAFLSGRNFARRAVKAFQVPRVTSAESAGEPSARGIADLARNGNRKALRAFDDYALHMAAAIQSYVAIFSPRVVVLAGSFASASDLFLPKTRTRLAQMVASRRVPGLDLLPKIVVSRLDNQSGLIGAAYLARQRVAHS